MSLVRSVVSHPNETSVVNRTICSSTFELTHSLSTFSEMDLEVTFRESGAPVPRVGSNWVS